MHMFAGCIKKKKSLKGYIDTGLVEVNNLKKRHDVIAKEMLRRGMNHQSPFPRVKLNRIGRVDSSRSRGDLKKRCVNCKF